MRITLTAAIVAAAVSAAAWFVSHDQTSPTDIGGSLDYLSYSPYGRGHSPKDQRAVPAEQIEADLKVISGVARGVRTYSVVDGVDQVPAIAEHLGLNVYLGAWVGDTPERDQMETEKVVQLAKEHRNVKAVLVGNEVLYRGERTVDELIQQIREVKKQVRAPVSTGEIWNIWLENPKLVNAVDFIAAHVLPYWEGMPADQVMAYTLDKIERLRQAYPGKRIVIAEFGWPSQGYNLKNAVPGALSQAEIVRAFVNEAERRGYEYNLVEAFDQPWKTDEGSVGAYWGLFDADRQAKFPLTGHVAEPSIAWQAGLSLAIGAALTLIGLRHRRPGFGHALLFSISANALSAGIALAIAYPFVHYMSFGIYVMWGIGLLTILPLTVITLTKVDEIGDVLFSRRPRRLITRDTLRPLIGRAPKVSIHIPAYREPAAMVIETLDSLAALDYPNFEAIVIINNTPEAHYSQPVAARCRELGDRFKFLDITCSGFKAGALNVALRNTAEDAEIIAVIDADYVVEPNWLRDLVPFFADPEVGLVQAPQDHRDGDESLLKRLMNAEYAGFFDIGMVQRNEDNAIIQHGTMCLVRRSALEQVGGWGTDTIVEDTDLGLRLYEAGYTAHYSNTRYGRGLLPDTYKAFKTQRFRWAYGAMQLIRKHGREVLPGAPALRPEQKFHFLAGWCLWLSDAVGAIVSVLNLLWVPVVILVGVVIPTMPFTLPVIAAFLVNLLHCALLYRRRVSIPAREIPGAALAAMSLQLTVARAVLFGALKDKLPFFRTEKGGAGKRGSDNPAKWETWLGLALATAAMLLVLFNPYRITEMQVFAATVAIQSLPFLAATAMVGIERHQGRLAGLRRRWAVRLPLRQPSAS